MPSEDDYRWRRDFRCANKVSFNEKCGQKGDRAVIIYQEECWKTCPLWYPNNGFPVTSEDPPLAGLICKHNHLTLVKNPVIDYTKSNANGNAGRWYVKCPTKEIDNQFDCDINATFFLCFADEALQKMVQYDEYHSDHVDIQCLQHNYLEFQQKMALQDEQAPASIVESQDTKWATSSCFTSISQQIGRRYTRHLGSATRKRGAMSRPIQSKISTSTRHLPQGQGDRKVKSWLDDENNLIQPETDPTSSLIQKPGLSEESEKEISFSDIDSVEYKTANQSPKRCSGNCPCLDCPRRIDNLSPCWTPTDNEEDTSLIGKITTAMYLIFINV